MKWFLQQRFSVNKIVLVFLFFSLSACDLFNHSNEQPADVPHASLDVRLISTDGSALAAVNVLVNNVSHGISDTSGSLLIDDLDVDSSMTLVFDKNNFASQVINHQTGAEGSSASIEVVMIPRQSSITFNNNTESVLTGQFGASIELKGNDFVDTSGAVVSGDIEMQITPVDVSTEAGLEAFPGSFSAIDDAGAEVPVIVTYGTTEFNFTKNSEPLQLANGKTAVIELPLFISQHPDGSDVALGDQIPLWYLDEDSGIWIQQGEGTVVASATSKTGFALRGEVSHFTWWNIDIPVDTGNISVKVDLSDSSIDTSGLSTVVVGKTERFSTGTVTLPVGQRSNYYKVPAGQELCFSAKVLVDSGTPNAQLFSSPLQCGVTLAPGENRNLDIVVNVTDFTITPDVVSTATVGSDISSCGALSRLVPNGYLAPVSYSVISGNLPAGVQLDANSGSLYGIPTQSGNSGPLVVRATDASGRIANSSAFSIDVSPELVLSLASEVPMLNVNQSYSFSNYLVSSGGYGSHVLGQYNDSSLPAGMIFNALSGTISGTPLALVLNTELQAHYSKTAKFQVTDQNCATARLDHAIRVLYAPDLSGAPAAELLVGNAIEFTATNNAGPVENWSLSGAPSWLSINNVSGALQGVPAESDIASNISFSIIAENNIAHPIDPAGHAELAVNLSVTQIAPLLSGASDVNMNVNQTVQLAPLNSGGLAASWSINSAPGWLSFNTSNGELMVAPLAGDEGVISNIIITATNAAGSSSYGPFSITVTGSSVLIPVISGTPATAKVDQAYSFIPSNSGGLADTWSLSGTLPAGLTFNSNSGEISGTPVTAGTFTALSVTASNASGPGNNHGFTMVVDKGDQLIAFEKYNQASVVRTVGGIISNIATGGAGSGAISYVSDTPATATVDPGTGAISISANGTTTITATKAADANYLASSTFFSLTVADDGPVIISGLLSVTQTVTDSTVLFSYMPVLESGLNIEWSASNLPNWASIDPSSGEITGYVDHYDNGIYANIVITATNTVSASSADLGPVSISLLLTSAPRLDTRMSGNALTVWHDGGGDLSWIPIANSGGYSNNWTISGDYPDQASNWLGVAVNPYQYPEIYQFENNPTLQHIGKWNVSLVAENVLGTDTLDFVYEVKLKIPRLNLRAKAGELVVDWAAIDQSALATPIPIQYDLYVSDMAGFTPENPQLLAGDILTNYASGTAINSVNGNPVSVAKTYYMMLVARYTNSESRTEEFKITVNALPDTGVIECTNGTTIDQYNCLDATVVTNYPNQDGGLGRSAMGSNWIGWPAHYTVPDYDHINDAGDDNPIFSEQHCVRDNVTGLLWQSATQSSVQQGQVDTQISALNDVSHASNCNRTDWRLPTASELFSIVHYRQYIKANNSFFSNIAGAQYWSADVVEPSASTPMNWTVDFANGLMNSADITTANGVNAILVSGSSNTAALVDNLDGTITDTVTALVWKKCAEGYNYNAAGATPADKCVLDLADSNTFSWTDGLIRARDVSNGSTGENYSNTRWRVPNIKELNSLLNRADAAGVAGMFDSTMMPNTAIENFWSSSINSYALTQALSLNLNDTGLPASTAISSLLPLRLVSSAEGGQDTTRWYRDADGDGYGIQSDFIDSVIQPENYVRSSGWGWDCDDSSATINPDAYEVIDDGIDNNCNGVIDEGEVGGV
ncbi:MAG: DUF1566 domain-containing protein [Gammaproteobacteria bacterium]|nr:DUF1566 domain-containing protein [Gammaproteobacteria bacterium]